MQEEPGTTAGTLGDRSGLMAEDGSLKLATWNVRTLANNHDDGEYGVGRLVVLAEDFKCVGLDIIVMQETRVSGTKEVISVH